MIFVSYIFLVESCAHMGLSRKTNEVCLVMLTVYDEGLSKTSRKHCAIYITTRPGVAPKSWETHPDDREKKNVVTRMAPARNCP